MPFFFRFLAGNVVGMTTNETAQFFRDNVEE